MRKVRTAVALASVATGLVVGLGSPAQAAAPAGRAATAATTSSGQYLFGMYYYEWACRYFGDSLTQNHAFTYYSCVWSYYAPDNAYYWFLYVW